MFLSDIFETVDHDKLNKAIKSFESHLETLDVESDKAADILQAVFSQVSNELKLDADTQIALSDYLKKEHRLGNLQENIKDKERFKLNRAYREIIAGRGDMQTIFNQVTNKFNLDDDMRNKLAGQLNKDYGLSLKENVVPLRRSETQRYDDAVAKQQGFDTEYRPESGPKGTSELGVGVVKNELLPIVDAGQLPDEYNGSIKDWLWDFWPELDWNDPRDDIKEILGHPEYGRIVQFFRDTYDFNFDKELKDAFYEFKDRDLGLPMSETSAGAVAGVNSALGAGDPKASIYYGLEKKKKKKKYESKYARMNQLAEQIATMEAQLVKNHAPSTQKLTEVEAEAVYIVKEMIESLDYNPDDAMKEAEGLLLHEGHDVEGMDWCSVADHILILN